MDPTSTMTLPDGRLLEYRVDGPQDGAALVFHHGTPGAAVPVPPLVDAAAALGMRTVVAARPGYGRSTPRPGRAVVDVAGDTAALLDHLGVGSFVTAGWSGGGPHALATAAVLAPRCRAVGTIAGVGPWDAPDLDFLAGMGEENLLEFDLATRGAGPLGDALAAMAAEMGPATVDGVIEGIGGLLPEVDRRQLRGPLGELLVTGWNDGLAAGVDGWRDDDLAFVRPWGFDLARLAVVAVTVWQGDLDLMVPETHGAWLGRHIPGAVLERAPGHGHLSLLASHGAAVVATLAGEGPR